MNTHDIERQRQAFEAFAAARNYDLDTISLLSKPPKFSHYLNQNTQAAFETWQTAIEVDRKQRHLKERAQLDQEWAALKGMQAQYKAASQSQDREDALRYRWLRNSDPETDAAAESIYEDWLVGDDLDAAIDARRIEGEGK